METRFSQNLIEETIQCFKEEDGLDISAETANQYLENLSGLFLVFADYRPQSIRPAGDADGSLDLISPHSC